MASCDFNHDTNQENTGRLAIVTKSKEIELSVPNYAMVEENNADIAVNHTENQVDSVNIEKKANIRIEKAGLVVYDAPKGFDPNQGVKSNIKSMLSKHKNDHSSLQGVKNKYHGKATVGGIIDSIVEDYDREATASAGTLVTAAGTYKRRIGVGAYAEACVAQCSAAVSVCTAAARALAASARAHAGWTGASAMATAELCRAEALVAGIGVGVGLQVDTGISVGAEGLQVYLAGFGASIGPKMVLKTPVADVSCNVM